MKPKWQIELNDGRIWRTKEILRTHISRHYDRNEYLAYGKILYNLQDLHDAGKYLFLAGEPINGQYKNAIEIYLNKFKNADEFKMSSTFPRSFNKLTYAEIPLSVKEYLEDKGFKNKKVHNNILLKNSQTSIKDKIIGYLLSGLIAIVFIVGVYKVSATVIGWFQNLSTYYYINKCLDAGGKWDEKNNECNKVI